LKRLHNIVEFLRDRKKHFFGDFGALLTTRQKKLEKVAKVRCTHALKIREISIVHFYQPNRIEKQNTKRVKTLDGAVTRRESNSFILKVRGIFIITLNEEMWGKIY
jgi:hypothetical protein